MLFCGEVFSQESIIAREVLVVGRKDVKHSAINRTIIDSAALAGSQTTSFAELLSKNSPVFIKSYGLGSQATISFRGTAASHTQVIWNGININNPMLGEVDFSTIPVWFTDQTELLHGGSSLTQGGGSLGGSVLVNSSPEWNNKLKATVMQSIGSFSTYQTFASVSGGTKNFRAKARYIYSTAQNDFTFYNNAIIPSVYQKQSNANYVKQGATLDLNAKFKGDNFISVNGWFFTDKRNLPTIMSYEGSGRDEHQTSNEFRTTLKWAKYGKKYKSNLVAGYTKTSLDYFLSNKTLLGDVVNYDSRSKIETYQANYSFEYTFNDNFYIKTLANAQYNSVSILDHTTNEGYSAKRLDYGVSASAHANLTDWMSGYALLRYENDGNFMPSIGLQFDPTNSVTIKINGAKNFHKPTLNDLHWSPGGNPNLLPESGYATDISATFSKFGLEATATAFASWIDNWIIWQPSEFRYWTATNMRKVFSRGMELNVKYNKRFGQFGVSINANYAYTRTSSMKPQTDDDLSVGKQLIYIPIHKANLFLEGSYKWFKVAYWYSFTGERFTTSSNDNFRHTLPQYGLHNVSLSGSWRGFEASLKIENLFDKDYQAILWRAMPKKNFQITLKYTIEWN